MKMIKLTDLDGLTPIYISTMWLREVYEVTNDSGSSVTRVHYSDTGAYVDVVETLEEIAALVA